MAEFIENLDVTDNINQLLVWILKQEYPNDYFAELEIVQKNVVDIDGDLYWYDSDFEPDGDNFDGFKYEAISGKTIGYVEDLDGIELEELVLYLCSTFDDDSLVEKVIALADEFDFELRELSDIEYTTWDSFQMGKKEYLVLDDGEANKKMDEWAKSYWDDCVLPDIPKPYRQWLIDEDMAVEKIKGDGRDILASYDGHERERRGYFIYRVN